MKTLEKIKDFLCKYRNIMLFAFYAAASLAILCHHEPFVDEINVWEVLKNVPLKDLPYHVSRDGHPIIYFLLWYPFVKLGLPFFFYRIMAWLACCAAVYLLLFFSPFSFPLKLIIVLSSPMMYWYPSVARSYSFLPVVIFSLAYLSGKIKDKNNPKYGLYIILFCTLAGLVSNLHLILGMFGGAVFLVLAYNKIKSKEKFTKHELAATIIFSILLAVPAVQTFIAYGTDIEFLNKTHTSPLYAIEQIFTYFVSPLTANMFIYKSTWISPHLKDILTFLSLFFSCILSTCLFLTDKKLFFIFATSSLYHLSVYIFKYAVFLPNRVYIFVIILLALIWAAADMNKKRYKEIKIITEFLIAMLLLPTLISGGEIITADWKMPFTVDIAMAEFIDKNLPEDTNEKIYMTDVSGFIGTAMRSQKHTMYDKDRNPIKYIAVYLQRSTCSIPEHKTSDSIYIIDYPHNNSTFNPIFDDKNMLDKLFCAETGIIGPPMCIYKAITN